MIFRFALTVLTLLAVAPAIAQEVGDSVEFQGERYIVLAIGIDEMSATASGESIVIVIEMATPLGVAVPDGGAEIRLDPAEPMMWVDGEAHRFFTQNATYLRANEAGKSFALLEYDRAAN